MQRNRWSGVRRAVALFAKRKKIQILSPNSRHPNSRNRLLRNPVAHLIRSEKYPHPRPPHLLTPRHPILRPLTPHPPHHRPTRRHRVPRPVAQSLDPVLTTSTRLRPVGRRRRESTPRHTNGAERRNTSRSPNPRPLNQKSGPRSHQNRGDTKTRRRRSRAHRPVDRDPDTRVKPNTGKSPHPGLDGRRTRSRRPHHRFTTRKRSIEVVAVPRPLTRRRNCEKRPSSPLNANTDTNPKHNTLSLEKSQKFMSVKTLVHLQGHESRGQSLKHERREKDTSSPINK